MKEKSNIPAADFPEQAGISSYEIIPFLNDFAANKAEIHSFMVIRNGKVAFETHKAPYGRYTRQAMFSVSRAFVAVAAGFAVQEGLISLDSKVADFFPEYRPSKRDKYLERLKIRHLLSMTSGKNTAPLSSVSAQDREKAFFKEKWSGEPGKTPGYTAENICIVCDILRKATGMTLTEYLTPRLYEPLEFDEVPLWEKDSTGIEGGYWGLYLTPEELARFSLCLMGGGVYKGRRVIPEDYVKEMLSVQASGVPFPNRDEVTDYGFFIRGGNLKNSFMIDGALSQFAVIAGDYDAALILTGSHTNISETRSIIFRHFHRMLVNPKESAPGDVTMPALEPFAVISSPRCEMEKEIKGKVIKFRSNVVLGAVGIPFSMLPITGIFPLRKKGGNINNVVFDFDKDGCIFTWDENRDHNMLRCPMDGAPGRGVMEISGFTYNVNCAAAWKNENTLEIQIRPLECVDERRVSFEFGPKNTVTLKAEETGIPEEIYRQIDSVAREFYYSDGRRTFNSLLSNFSFILDSPLKGKIN